MAPRLTDAQYLELERAADFRSEFHGGEMFAMAGGSIEHSMISTNLLGELRRLLKGKPCAPYDSNLRVHIPTTGLYTYPDALVICGEPEFIDQKRDCVTNPTLIVEILSPSTESYDRGRKFDDYRTLTSLKEFVLISQSVPAVDVFRRAEETQWVLTPVRGLGTKVLFSSLGIELPLDEIYDRLSF